MRSLSWLYEMPLTLAAVWAAQRLILLESAGPHDLNPSPLWLLPLLFGLRYGLGAGTASGAAAALAHAVSVRAAGEGYRLADADFYLQPGLYVIVGIGLGFVADRHAHRLSALRSNIEELRAKLTSAVNLAASSQKAMRAVEQQVVSQMSSVATLYHGSRELGTLDRDALPGAIREFFTAALQAETASLYLPVEGKWPKEASGTGTIGRALAERRLVTARETSAQDALLAFPILDPEGNAAMVYAVHSMPFLRFNSATVNLAALLAEWGQESLAKCVEVERLKARSLVDEEMGVHGAAYLLERAASEERRWVALLVSVVIDPEVPESRRPALLRSVGGVLRRSGGLAGRSPAAKGDFAVLFTDAGVEEGERERAALLGELNALSLPAKIAVEIREELG